MIDRQLTEYLTFSPHPHTSHAESHADALYEPSNAANANRLRIVTNLVSLNKPGAQIAHNNLENAKRGIEIIY